MATMKSSGPMMRTWLAAVLLSRGECGTQSSEGRDWESLISWRRELASDSLQQGGTERGKQAMSLGSWTCPSASIQLQLGVPKGLHEDRGLFWFTPRKERVTRWLSLHREALNVP